MWTGAFLLLLECAFLEGTLRIIGGTRSTILRYPYVASLQADGRHVCGAAIISPNIVVSAAHCIRFSPDAYAVRVGSTYWNDGGYIYNVSDIKKHPGFNRRTSDNDICLIFLSQNVTYSRIISPIALPSPNDTLSNSSAKVCGWGTTTAADNTEVSPFLKEVQLPLLDWKTCKSMFPPNSITKNMLCAMPTAKQDDSSTGDSGGPLVASRKLIGVVSWSFSCAGSTPGVYTNVAEMLPFIRNYTKVT